ncbi:MAG TPA: DUF3365 domain-containing protein [Hyphomonas sp.]|nr:DUF3365 domain-containing protein [Hyphomonas sp.]
MAHLPVQTKPAVLALLLAGVLAACGRPEPAAPVANPTPTEQEIAGARDAASQLGSRLKARLMAAMSEGGPIAAIEVCAEEAPQIAQQVSEETGYRVGRTSLRVRNPANAPDAWEQEQLMSFMKDLQDGADPAGLEAAEIVTDGGREYFRWARPIMLEAPCATCHGQSVSPEILAEIKARYPDDTATGFAVGDLRGMFTVSK